MIGDTTIPKEVPKLFTMLMQTPVGALKEATDLWKKQRRLTIDWFQNFWDKIESSKPMLD